ncbi:conjugative transposon protein TcpC [Nocardiopsis sp. Huas11]|uniref:conjugal transfer protein n=1 Tax=Nocardiopsis sp. Huas11 TaxID=2183912 RepID=UPI000EB15810|nr:conjugal transfer protein [Nocardiopsis sp. Huas11]RKS10799.1 conjugative transposon protein TcpC [Nocardiopsis sp. Huas11]
MAKASRRGTAARDLEDDAELGAPRARRPRAGAGGRWWVGVGRAVLWAFIIVVIFNGIWFPLRGGLALPAPSEEPQETETAAFPETAAAAFALRFADTYLDTEDPEARLEALAAYVPEGEAAALDAGADSLTGENLTVTSIDVADDNNAVVVVRGDVNGGAMSLEVPVYADGEALAVSGPPALLAAPTRASLPQPASVDEDAQAAEALQGVLNGFFDAYAEGPEHLEQYVERGAAITPLPENSLSIVELSDVVVPSQTATGDDDVRQVALTALWSVLDSDGAEVGRLRQSYLVTVVNSGSEWRVRDIQGAPHSFGD